MMKHVVLCVIIAVAVAISVEPQYFKHVQGPPEEFVMHTLPNPVESALASDSAFFPVYLDKQPDDTWMWQGDVPIDSNEQFQLHVISRLPKLEVKIANKLATSNEAKTFVSLSDKSHPFAKLWERIDSWMGWSESSSVPTTTYIIDAPVQGLHTVQIISHTQPPANNNKPPVYIMLYNRTPLRMHSHLTGSYHQLLINSDVAMQTRMYDQFAFNEVLNKLNLTSALDAPRGMVIQPEPLNLNKMKLGNQQLFVSADMDVVMPDGEEKVITMHDDGMNNDANANDGIFGGSFRASQEGAYVAQVVMRGISPTGAIFVRSASHLFTVIENDGLVLQDKAAAVIDTKDEMMKVQLRIQFDPAAREKVLGQKFKAYAEVWGTPVSNAKAVGMVPAAFVTGMAIATVSPIQGDNDANVFTLELQLSTKWLSRAQVSLPLVLKNVYVQDSQNSIPVAQSNKDIVIDTSMISLVGDLALRFRASADKAQFLQSVVQTMTNSVFKFDKTKDTVTETMLFGKRPLKYELSNRSRVMTNGTSKVDQGKLIVIHGYCASECPFDTSAFQNFEVFCDFNKNRLNDQFALLVRDFADKYEAFSVVGHSQGGLASLHLRTFYWSNGDGSRVNDDNNRDIQSVGSPYKGSSLAGGFASLGDVFGVGCGKNTDMTKDGANLWLSTIPSSIRKHLYYYTTQYADWSWCNLAANAVLQWPNDGVAEKELSDLSGANNEGHVKKQCHSVGLKYEAQCKNLQRNAIINAKASRGL